MQVASKRSIVAGIAVVAGVVLFGFGAKCIHRGWDWHRRFERWLVEEPVKMDMDLASPGMHSSVFEQTCAVAHAQCVVLIPKHAGDLPRLRHAISNVSVSIHQDSASENLAVEVPVSEPLTEQEVSLARLHPVPDGRYTFSATVAPSETITLPVILVMRNELCGLERLPGTVSSVVGWTASLAGVPALIGGCFGLRRRKAGTVATRSMSEAGRESEAD